MSDLQPESTGPTGDSSRHLPLAGLDAALQMLPAAPTDTGRLVLIVARRADGALTGSGRVPDLEEADLDLVRMPGEDREVNAIGSHRGAVWGREVAGGAHGTKRRQSLR